jgi:hypothetical protein
MDLTAQRNGGPGTMDGMSIKACSSAPWYVFIQHQSQQRFEGALIARLECTSFVSKTDSLVLSRQKPAN